MLDLDKNEVIKVIIYPDKDGKGDEWYELRHIPYECFSDYEDDSKLFNHAVVNWGGILSGGKEIKCTEETKEAFYRNKKSTADRVAWILEVIPQRTYFSLNFEELCKRLGKLYPTSANGATNNQTHISPVADDAVKS